MVDTYQAFRAERMEGRTPVAEAAPPAAVTEEPTVAQDSSPAVAQEPPVDDDTSEALDTPPEDDSAAKRRRRNDNRYQRLVNDLREQSEARARLEGELAAVKELLSQRGTEEPAARTRDDYASDEEYYEAQLAKATQAFDKQMADLRSEFDAYKAQQADMDRRELSADKLDAAREAYDDFTEVVGSSDIQINETVRDALDESAYSGHLVYYLAQHPDEADALNEMSASQVGRAFAKIEATFDAPSEPDPPPPRAEPPAPIAPVSGNGAGPVDPTPGQMSYSDYRALQIKRQQEGLRQ